jgi:hypothetical protein
VTGIIVDGVAYTPAMIRTIARERHQLASDIATLRDTLRRRTDALNRTAAENEGLRTTFTPAE